MEQPKEYFAFISYQRKDEEWADRLRNKLEHYRLPSNVRKQDASLPKEIRPIFRDALELAGGVLAKEIETALQQSKFLIVICSPNSAKSPWVNKEIKTFIDLGREDRIIPFIIDGTPFSDNEETECFPPALRSLKGEKELLGININELSRDAASIKVVARMFGLKFDTLWQRYERGQQKKRRVIVAAISIFLSVTIAVAGWIWHQNVLLNEKDIRMMINQSRFISEKASDLINEGNSYMAQRILLDVIMDKPYTIESERTLRKATNSNSAILYKHADAVNDVAINPDGTEFVTASGDSTLIIWDIKAGTVLQKLSGHRASINSVAYSLDGKRLVSASFDKTVKIWDAKTGNSIRTITGHKSYVNSAVFSPDGKSVVSASGDGTLKFWSVSTGNIVRTIYAHDKSVSSVVFSPNRRLIVSASKDSSIKIWDSESGNILHTLKGHTASVNSLSISPNGKYIASSSDDHSVRIWDVETGSLHSVMNNHSHPVLTVAFSPDSKRLVSGSVDKTLLIYDVVSGVVTDSLKGHSSYVYSAVFSPGGEMIISTSRDKSVRIWDLRKCTALFSFEGTSNSFSPDSKYLIVISKDKNVECFSTITGKLSAISPLSDIKANFAYFSPNGRYCVTSEGQPTNVTCIWDLNNWNLVHSIDGHFLTSSSDDNIVVTSSFELIAGRYLNTLRVYDIQTGEMIHTHKGESYVNSASISPDGKKIALASDENRLEIIDLFTSKQLILIEVSEVNKSVNI